MCLELPERRGVLEVSAKVGTVRLRHRRRLIRYRIGFLSSIIGALRNTLHPPIRNYAEVAAPLTLAQLTFTL